MSAVAEALRDEQRQLTARLSGTERLALALALGQRDLDLYMQARCVDRQTARAVVAQARRIGRRRSACLEPDSN
jgi:hypothetical protein